MQLQILNVKTPDEIDTAFSSMVRDNVGALSVLTQAMLVLNGKRLVSSRRRAGCRQCTQTAGLRREVVSCPTDQIYSDLYRRAAIYVDKILKGAKPADLPCGAANEIRAGHQLKHCKGARSARSA